MTSKATSNSQPQLEAIESIIERGVWAQRSDGNVSADLCDTFRRQYRTTYTLADIADAAPIEITRQGVHYHVTDECPCSNADSPNPVGPGECRRIRTLSASGMPPLRICTEVNRPLSTIRDHANEHCSHLDRHTRTLRRRIERG